jgi:polysaccharide pyruvyl transferase WcaK-like protein
VCKAIQREIPECSVAPFFYTPTEAKSYVSGLDMLIGARMHCCIAAYSSGVPVYPLAYSRKFRGLFRDELRYPYGAELTSESTTTVIANLQHALYELPRIRSEMPGRVEALKTYKAAFLEDLKTNVLARFVT